MNAHMQEAMTDIAQDAGAIVPCGLCGNYDIRNENDPEADSLAYAMATNAWKGDQFRSASLEEAKKVMKATLSSANDHCPFCHRY